jgi:hypothetical protein
METLRHVKVLLQRCDSVLRCDEDGSRDMMRCDGEDDRVWRRIQPRKNIMRKKNVIENMRKYKTKQRNISMKKCLQ